MTLRHTRRRLAVPLASTLVLILGLSLTAVVPAGATTCLPGTGTAGDPFLVDSQADLELVGSGTNGCDPDLQYRQTADITLAGNWTPLTPSTAFSGVYDGGGHTIAGLTVTGASNSRGLFAKATTGAVFRDLTLENVSVAGDSAVGGLVGELGAGTVEDVTVTGTVTADGDIDPDPTLSTGRAGGIAGTMSNGVIRRTTFAGTVTLTGATEAGGIVGLAGAATIEDVHASGTVSGPTFVGGVIGNLSSGSTTGAVIDSSFSGTVTASSQTAGGLIGQASGRPSVTRSWSTGSVAAARNAGGLVGTMTASAMNRGFVTYSYSTASVAVTAAGTTDPDLGGLIGFMTDITIDDSYARGDLTNAGSAKDTGGLVGDVATGSDNRIREAYATGRVPGSNATAGSIVGGLAGGTGDIDVNSFWDTQTTGQTISTAGTGKTTAEMKTLATFTDTATVGLGSAWQIVDGWQPYSAGVRTWGICPRVNDGYPFLLWQYDSDPCTTPAAAAPTLGVTCATDVDGTVPVGSPITCTLTGGPADFDILWRAAYNPTFAEGVIRTGTDGTGTLTLTLPAAAAGSPITVELVAWTAPIHVGTATGSTADGPVPTGIPAGDAPSTRVPLGLLTTLTLTMLAPAMLLASALRRSTANGTRPR